MFQDIRRHEFSAVQRSYLWPTLLIGLGLVWLLRELELFSNANLAILLRLWPLILIVIGVEVFLRDESRRIRQIVALGGLALVAVLVAVAPALGLWQVNAKSFDKMVALDNTTSATVNLNLGVGANTVGPLSDSPSLFKANSTYLGELNYAVSGDQEKTITLDNPADGLNFLDWFGADLHTNVGLTSAVPIKLTLVNGSGRSTLDLATLKLTTLTVNSGSGVVSATLPSWTQPYVATITGGSGMQNITIPANTSVDLRLTGGSGSTRITIGSDVTLDLKYIGGSGILYVDVPDSAAVRLQASAGSGVVSVGNIPCATNSQCSRIDGTWESAGYKDAQHKITINARIGSGSITVR